MKKRKLIVNALAVLLCITFTGCRTSKNVSVIKTGENALIHETKFNSAYVNLQNDDFANIGISFGDSCNVYFSNGKEILDVPYYDGYYTRSDYPLICGYQGYPYVQITVNNSSTFWDDYELSENDTVNIVLNKKGKYLNEQEAFSMKYSNERSEYPSDEAFANFRMIQTGNLKENVLYRGASPFNNTYNRSPYVDKLLKENNVNYILDLADAEEDYNNYLEKYDFSSSYAVNLEKSFLNMGSNFRDSKYKESLVKGLKEMMQYEGKYYIHCTEGKDRTGFVCALLEGLCNASYEEMVSDYMMTYKNYFKMSESDAKYDAVIHLRFDEFMEYLSGETDTEKIKKMNYAEYCKNYLLEGNMSSDEIDTLVNKLTK